MRRKVGRRAATAVWRLKGACTMSRLFSAESTLGPDSPSVACASLELLGPSRIKSKSTAVSMRSGCWVSVIVVFVTIGQ